MTNQKSEKTLVSYAVVINLIQILLCLFVYILRLFDLTAFAPVQIVLLFLELLAWFICSIMFGLGMNVLKIRDALTYAIVAVLPITVLTAISALLGYLLDSHGGWAGFFFIGSAVNFWMRPALALSHIINNSGYLLYGIHILILFLLNMIGVNFTISLNRSRNKKVKLTRTKKKNNANTTSNPSAAEITSTEKKAEENAESDIINQNEPYETTVSETEIIIEEKNGVD
ncbi:MAG: hypothetical protein ACC608_03325 [Anaerofustis sp.]